MSGTKQALILRSLLATALVLAALIVILVFRCVGFLRADACLKRIAGEADATTSQRLQRLDEFPIESASTEQSRRFDELVDRTMRDILVDNLDIDDRPFLVASGGIQGPGAMWVVPVRNDEVRLGFREDLATITRGRLASIRLGGESIDAGAEEVSEVLPLDRTPKRIIVSFTKKSGSSTSNDGFGIEFVRDLEPPTIGIVDDQGRRFDTETRIEVREETSLMIHASDAKSAATIAISRESSAIEPTRRADGTILIERIPRTALPLTLGVIAVDLAGNRTERSIELVEWHRPAPTLERLEIANKEVKSGADVSLGKMPKTIEMKISGTEKNDVVRLEVDGDSPMECTYVGDAWTIAVESRHAEPEFRKATVKVEFKSDGTIHEIADWRFRTDLTAPRIVLARESEPNVALSPPTVAARSGEAFFLSIDDESGLDAGHEMSDRRGGVRAEAPVITASEYRRRFTFGDVGTIVADAIDGAGNRARLEFAIESAKPARENDGAVPSIEVSFDGTPLAPDAELVFFRAAPKLELMVEDGAGIDRSRIKIEPMVEIDWQQTSETRLAGTFRPEGSFDIEAADEHGNRGRRHYGITIVGDDCRLLIGAKDATLDEINVVSLPVKVKAAVSNRPPANRLRMRLEPADEATEGDAVDVTFDDLVGEIPANTQLMKGRWRADLLLETAGGPVTILSVVLSTAEAPREPESRETEKAREEDVERDSRESEDPGKEPTTRISSSEIRWSTSWS